MYNENERGVNVKTPIFCRFFPQAVRKRSSKRK
jgi:hypothetical protein